MISRTPSRLRTMSGVTPPRSSDTSATPSEAPGRRSSRTRRESGAIPYLELKLAHSDGTVVEIVHGDGYTELVGGPLSYRHYLATGELVSRVVS